MVYSSFADANILNIFSGGSLLPGHTVLCLATDTGQIDRLKRIHEMSNVNTRQTLCDDRPRSYSVGPIDRIRRAI